MDHSSPAYWVMRVIIVLLIMLALWIGGYIRRHRRTETLGDEGAAAGTAAGPGAPGQPTPGTAPAVKQHPAKAVGIIGIVMIVIGVVMLLPVAVGISDGNVAMTLVFLLIVVIGLVFGIMMRLVAKKGYLIDGADFVEFCAGWGQPRRLPFNQIERYRLVAYRNNIQLTLYPRAGAKIKIPMQYYKAPNLARYLAWLDTAKYSGKALANHQQYVLKEVG